MEWKNTWVKSNKTYKVLKQKSHESESMYKYFFVFKNILITWVKIRCAHFYSSLRPVLQFNAILAYR